MLLVASVVTTTANGARFMHNFVLGLPPVASERDLWPWMWLARHPRVFPSGFAFSLTLLGILLIHEFGHYFACVAHRVICTPPFVIPAPTLSGTFGAVIRIRSFIPNRDALMDIGIYGPVAGYLVSTIAVAVGFVLSVPRAPGTPESLVRFGGDPLTMRLVHALLLRWNPQLPGFEAIIPHPILIAGWIGLFITALNLIPGGQLDGGHILYALSPRLHRAANLILPIVLLAAGAFYWAGWTFWGIILLIPIFRHQRIPLDTRLAPGRIALGFVGIAIFLLTFTPTPFYDNSLIELLR